MVLKLLIVDDNASIRRFIRRMVMPIARSICECADGADALSAYIAEKPDVVLMDIRMKEMDGIQATQQIRNADPQAKILIVTDFDDEGLREASAHAGACGYVLKDNLLELVRLLEGMEQRSSEA